MIALEWGLAAWWSVTFLVVFALLAFQERVHAWRVRRRVRRKAPQWPLT